MACQCAGTSEAHQHNSSSSRGQKEHDLQQELAGADKPAKEASDGIRAQPQLASAPASATADEQPSNAATARHNQAALHNAGGPAGRMPAVARAKLTKVPTPVSVSSLQPMLAASSPAGPSKDSVVTQNPAVEQVGPPEAAAQTHAGPMQRENSKAALHHIHASPEGSLVSSNPPGLSHGSTGSSLKAAGGLVPAQDAHRSPAASVANSLSSEDFGIPSESARLSALEPSSPHKGLHSPAAASGKGEMRSGSRSAYSDTPVQPTQAYVHPANMRSSFQGTSHPASSRHTASHAPAMPPRPDPGSVSEEDDAMHEDEDAVGDAGYSSGDEHRDGASEAGFERNSGLRASTLAKLRWSSSSASSSGASMLEAPPGLRNSTSQQLHSVSPNPLPSLSPDRPADSPSLGRKIAHGNRRSQSGSAASSFVRQSAIRAGSLQSSRGPRVGKEEEIRGSKASKGRKRTPSSSDDDMHAAEEAGSVQQGEGLMTGTHHSRSSSASSRGEGLTGMWPHFSLLIPHLVVKALGNEGMHLPKQHWITRPIRNLLKSRSLLPANVFAGGYGHGGQLQQY